MNEFANHLKPIRISIEFKEIIALNTPETHLPHYPRFCEVMNWLIVKKGSFGMERTNTFE